MSLKNQVHIYSTATDNFYFKDEQAIHEQMLKLYKACFNLKEKNSKNSEIDLNWKIASFNRLIKKKKKQLTDLLDSRLEGETIRQLNPNALATKNVISLFVSSLTRAIGLETGQLTEDLMVVNVYFFQVFENLIKYGFIHNGEKYRFLTASAGQIRQKKAVFIKESVFNQIEQRIMCGLTIEDINRQGGINSNKFMAYLALMGSATEKWEDFDIDKSIVVEDFETAVNGTVDFIDDADYSITRKDMDVPIPHMDGCGIMLDRPTRMVRLPWVKGLLVYFPFDRFVQEKCGGEAIVTDIYGQDHDIIAEDIRYIFTKSQFKLHKYYASWECYKTRFKAFDCEASYCNMEEDFIPKSRINYQMLQTLGDMTDDEIQRLIKRSVEEINTIGQDYQTTMRLLGATDYNTNPNYFQQALMIYPELFRDTYFKDILKQTKKSLVKQAKAGRLRVNGKYLFLSPDLYAFCEWLFLGEQNPKGLLQDGEVYCREYRDGDELACLRSPHLYKEWAVKNNMRNKELDRWFGETKCVYTSCHDLITKMLQNDNDGDKALVIKDRMLTKVAKRNMQDVVPLYYEMKKAKGGMLNPQAYYDGMSKAFTSGNIGPKSNLITIVHNNGQENREEADRVVKWLCFEVNHTIDFSKTLYMPTRPKEAGEIIKKHTKGGLPNFFIYAKDKKPSQVEQPNNSTMNRIASAIPSSRVAYCNSVKKFDYRMLMNLNEDFTVKENPIIERYNYWLRGQYTFDMANIGVDNEDLWLYKHIGDELLEYGNKDYVANTLISYCYTIRPNSNKKLLWNCFGDVIVENLKSNTVELGKVCKVCGKRFKPKQENYEYCSEDCYKINKNELNKIYYHQK